MDVIHEKRFACSTKSKLRDAPVSHELPVDNFNGYHASPETSGRCHFLTRDLTKSFDKKDKNEIKKEESNPCPSRITRETILLSRFTANEGGNGNRSLQNLFWKFEIGTSAEIKFRSRMDTNKCMAKLGLKSVFALLSLFEGGGADDFLTAAERSDKEVGTNYF
ncbi:hypothetical protein HNY73_004897 [Argiope bruennichi]|uniref:Uncharacterized protein n=1 Tax=Argiope bruennichi TaxID=94029 RepID=A0A8T0FSX9_ARGBR|nr:hypothetical protein HNY73_004897 [Argiope bruennichi]